LNDFLSASGHFADKGISSPGTSVTFGIPSASKSQRTGVQTMSEPRTVLKVERVHPVTAWMGAFSQSSIAGLSRTGAWAANTAQQFGSIVAVLMGPAVLSVYAFALWSLTSEMGWTDSFPFSAGPLSNWIIWLFLAVLLHISAHILRRQMSRG